MRARGVERQSSAGPSTAPAELVRAPFPTMGVGLMAIVVGVGIVRELLTPEPTNHTRPVALLVGVMLDIGFLIWLAPRVDRRVSRATRATLATLAINAGVAIVYWLAIRGLLMVVHPGEPARLLDATGSGLLWSFEVFALWAIGFRHPDLVRTAQLRELEADRLRKQAALVQLRAHLQPHFLRNTLNAISALVSEDPRQARRLIAALGDLLSDGLASDVPTHSLGDELDWLKRYAEIMETRHRGSLTFVWEVDPAITTVPLPTLLLQPLVENAVLHGALARDGAGCVTIRAQARAGGGARVSVEDDGPGIANIGSISEGVGLRLVRGRLAAERPDATLALTSNGTGTRAVLELP